MLAVHASHAPHAPHTLSLDHASFPHIFSSVLSYASTSSLGALRPSCKEIQHQVDVLLATHLNLDVPPSHPLVRFRDREGKHIPGHADDTILPRAAPQRTRVLDLATARAVPQLSTLRTLLPNLHTVRFLNLPHASHTSTTATTVVVFQTIGLRASDTSSRAWGPRCVLGPALALPAGPRRAVFNLRYTYPLPRPVFAVPDWSAAGELEVVVVIFSPSVPPARARRGEREHARVEEAALRATVGEMSHPRHGAGGYVFVGLPFLHDAGDGEGIAAAIGARYAAAGMVEPKVVFLSVDEYRAGVSGEQFELEMFA